MKIIALKTLSLFTILLVVCVAHSKKQEHDVKFYKRDSGVTLHITYYDYLAIDNYTDGLLRIKDFYRIAKNYVDTVKADQPVAAVTFLGKKHCCEPPEPGFDISNSVSDLELISFSFTTINKSKELVLFGISLRGNHDKESYMNVVPNEKEKIDSLMASEQVYKCGF